MLSDFLVRSVAASVYGWRLRSLRYGPESADWVCEAREREAWDHARWEAWQSEVARRLIERAHQNVPHYAAQFKLPPSGNGGMAAGFAGRELPLLEKHTLRTAQNALIARGWSRRRLWAQRTSGSTGTPVLVWQTREAVRRWYALCEARWRGWHGLSRHDRWGILGGRLVVPVGRIRPPFWVWNAALHQLYMSSYHISAQNARGYLAAMADWRLSYLWGYASALASLSRLALEQGLVVPSMKAVISNAEPLYQNQRDLIRAAFGCPVYDTYGMSEMVAAASECEYGKMHLWPEVAVYEVIADDEDRPVAPGEAGRLVVTGLLNEAMPLIRYVTGDRVALEATGTSCLCGRTLPILARIEGRCDDTIVTPDGRRVGRLDPVFKADLPIIEAQIVQVGLDHVKVRVVPGEGYGPDTEDALRHGLGDRLYGMSVSFERCTEIPRGRNGKFKAVVSEVSSDEKQASSA